MRGHQTIQPTRVALALSVAYGGSCRLTRDTSLQIVPCPACVQGSEQRPAQRMTVCPTCRGALKVIVL